ncbi:hypothetical protein P153DRAFT_351175 [Dothidotthia symphoricarpi CBS 119687]|uniref:Kelch repeat protein n=1 Tax=Dothidotthia symphoricarpi CBS 119687 TaxID=1392245 RepID=A0A6A5ZZE3_9PLEO|nr:uncharacterized protein P153DRAFT_351175 [Dothidotthia symphoricarpi CBS 119687]KAF2124264.1 hypothetical protein P153DRAFT_351175 [Dothidotthia symphoricarpi CBS 119687]
MARLIAAGEMAPKISHATNSKKRRLPGCVLTQPRPSFSLTMNFRHWFTLLCLAALVPAQDTVSELHSSIVRRFFHSSVILGETLYIDGGEVTTTAWEWGKQINNWTIGVDLSKPFSTSQTQSRPSAQLIAKNNCPNLVLPTFWVNKKENTAYTWGGQMSFFQPNIESSNIPPVELWALTPDTGLNGSWSKIEPGSDTLFPKLDRPVYGASTYSDQGGFYLSGKYSSSKTPGDSDYVPLPGLLYYDYEEKSWTNKSATSLPGGGFWEKGNAQYVPTWGTEGLLVIFGGVDMASHQSVTWSNITVFDIGLGSWYAQSTSGDTPSRRDLFCSVGVGSSSGDTYEIFVYGGSPLETTDNIKDTAASMYVLTLPAFTWFKVNATTDARYIHTCHVAGQRQMLSIGGLDPSLEDAPLDNTKTTSRINETDPYLLGIKVFDLTELVWTNSFDPGASAYTAPNVIASYYGGQIKYPNRWNDIGLEWLFTRAANNISSQSPTATPEDSEVATGVIAGSVVGGVVGLLIVGGLIYWRVLRRRKLKAQYAAVPPSTKGDTVSHPTEMYEEPGKPLYELGSERSLHELGSNKPLPELETGNVNSTAER